MDASNLDIEKFRKVHVLMTRGATEGERAAAKARAEALAMKAGMTLSDAIKEADKRKDDESSSTQSPFGFKTQTWEEYWEEQQPERDARMAEAERKYGPADEAFKETPDELRLRTFLEPFATYKKYTNVDELYVDGYLGWGHKYHAKGQAHFRKLMNEAIPLASTLPELIDEWKKWDILYERRHEYDAYYDTPVYVRARVDVLEYLITNVPVRHWDDMDVRLGWLRDSLDRHLIPDIEKDIAAHARLKADLEFLRTIRPASPNESATAQPAQNGRRTNADKAADVKALLQTNPELSDREISRRAGVHLRIVGKWRAIRNQYDLFST